jgi:hypothetical protein
MHDDEIQESTILRRGLGTASDAGLIGLCRRLVVMREREAALIFAPVRGHQKLAAIEAEIAAINARLYELRPTSIAGARALARVALIQPHERFVTQVLEFLAQE